MPLNSKQLWQERSRLAEEQHKAADSGDQNKALIIEGQIQQIDLTLEHVIEEEDAARNAPAPKVPTPKASFAERILGPRDEFRGLYKGFTNEATVVTVGAPTEIELTLDPKRESMFGSFAETLRETPAKGSVKYLQRSAQTGMPATWGGVVDGTSTAKAKVMYSYKEAVANKETIAGYVPVSEDTLLDYDELMSIIEHDLLLDLDSVTDGHMYSGNNSTGIIGVKNTTGILEFEEHVGGLYYEAIRKMRTKVMLTAKRAPTHVLVSPTIKQEIDLYKTETGLYQSITGDILWGMKVVEDPNCDGLIVYDSYAAERRSIHGTTVKVDTINDQFIHNELCIRAEHTKALQVRYPDAFCYASKTNLDTAAA